MRWLQPRDRIQRFHRRSLGRHPDREVTIEAFYEQCVANGLTILRPLAATEWGTKDFYMEDPDGHIIAFGGRG